MKNNKTLRYGSIHLIYAEILLLTLIIIFGISFCGSKEILLLSFAFIIFIFWQTFYAKEYRLNGFFLKNNRLKIQTTRGLNIRNINIDINEIQKFQVNVNVDYKRVFSGIFEINLQIDLNNGQQYEIKNYTKQMILFETLAKLVKEIPNAKIFVYSNMEKGLYSQESLKYYIENQKYSNDTISTRYIGIIVIIAIMILSFIAMIFA